MEVLQSRTDSFKTKRVQNPVKPSSSVNLKWPHPRRFNASPAALAEAGFYFNPSYEDRDSVTCFYCDKQLSHWEAEDDPFDIHWKKCRTTCCWAIVRCGLRGDMDSHRRFVSADKSRLPTSKNMEQARLGTFRVGNGWIHDQVEDHGANSRKMARAGFVYTPQHEGDDLATCLYCEVSLGGWDAEDDPMEEHNKRGNKSGQQCAFLATLEFTAMTTTPASRSLSQSKPSSKSTQSKSKHKDIVLPTKTHDGELEDDSEGGVPPAASSAKRSTRGRSTSSSTRSASGSSRSTKAATTVGKTPKKHTRSQSRGGLKDVNEDVEDAGGERKLESIPTKTRRTTAAVAKTSRSRSKSVSRPIPGAFPGDEEDIEEVVEKKSVKDRSKAKEEACIEGDGEVEEVKVLKKSTRGKPKAMIEGDEVEEVTNLKKSTRGRPKARIASTEEEPVEEDEGERASRKPSRTKSKAKPEPEQEPEEDVEEMAKPPSKARPKTIAPVTRKPSRTKPKPPVVEELEDVEETLPTPAIPVIPKKTRAASSSANPKARSISKPKPNAHLMEVEDVVLEGAMEEADEMDVFVHTHPSPPPEPPSSPPVLSNEKEREGLSEPEELSPLVMPKRSTKGKGKDALADDQQGKENSRAGGQGTVSKAKEKQNNKALPTTVVGESSEEAPEPRRSTKPPPKATSSREIPAKVQAPTGDVEKIKIKKAGNARKGIKVVEISTDEEIGDDDMKDEAQHRRSTTNQRVETLKPKPEEKDPFVETAAQSSKPGAPWLPSPTHTTTKTPIKEPKDVEMPGADDDLRVEDQQPQNHIEQDQEDPPKTPPLGRTNDPLSQSDPLPASAPTLIFPPLSKLPFTPIQNLSEAELDMTVEEWIRYQMEVEYDKFRRDGERELGRFKQRAEEVRGIIKGL